MTNEKLNEQLKQLNEFVVKSNKHLDVAEQSVNLSMESVINNADATELKQIQSHVANVKILLNKAKKGKDVESEIKQFSKNLKNAGTNKR
tara:strand:+ start:48 stop:317 length:270 start_codon:yes stop_codon:yes gene_type:complete